MDARIRMNVSNANSKKKKQERTSVFVEPLMQEILSEVLAVSNC